MRRMECSEGCQLKAADQTDMDGSAGNREAELEKIRGLLRAGDHVRARYILQSKQAYFGNDPVYHELKGVAALRAGDALEAQSSFDAAIRASRDPAGKAAGLAGLAELRLAENRPESAEEFAKQALSWSPRDLSYLLLLARCYSARGDTDRATALLESAMRSAPPDVCRTLRLQIADNLMNAGRAQDALPFLDAVEQEQPEDIEALARKAVALVMVGRLAEAVSYYTRVLEIQPSLPIYATFVQLKSNDGDPSLIPLLEKRLAECEPANAALLTNLHFALATAYDHEGDYEAAFSHLERGNALERSRLQFNLPEQRRAFAQAAAFFNKQLVSRFSGKIPVSEGATPIFIVGMPRSGTTLVEQILGAHSQVHAAGELAFMDQITAELGSRWAQLGAAALTDSVLQANFERAARRYRKTITQYAKGARFVTDKLPLNFRHLGLIKIMFPDAVLLHCERNPLDTCLSCYQQLFSSSTMAFTYDLKDLGEYYCLYRQYMSHWSSVLGPSAWLNIGYESLVSDVNGKVRELLSYCKLSFEPACAEFQKSSHAVLTASAIQVRRPVNSESVGKWRHYEAHLGPLMAALGPYAGHELSERLNLGSG